MKLNKSIALGMAIALLGTSCKSSQQNNQQNTMKTTTHSIDLKSLATRAQDAFFNRYNAEEVQQYFSENYIQHNPHVPTGIAPVLGFLPVLEKAQTKSTTHRMLQDGNFIVMHNSYINADAFGAPEVVTFDVWRMENGRVAEHWDAITPKVQTTKSGRSQVDGPTAITDLDKTEENKTLVSNFVKDVLFGKHPERITQYLSTTQYDQHNPMVADGLQGLSEAIDYLTAQGDMFVYKKTHKILGEGNFVLTISEGSWHQRPHAFYDLFRVADGKIVEHWDVIQEIPSEMAHTNGMF